jgi:predicted nucleotidyltransferase
MTATAQSVALRSIAQAIADALPPAAGEVVVTGSVSRGDADEISDIEMLIVTESELDLEDCFALAAACGLTDLGTWGQQCGPTKRVSGYRDGVPIELIWWSRAHAESAIDAIFAGDRSTTADAIANGVALRTSGLLRAVAGAAPPLPGRACQGADRGCSADLGRICTCRSPEARPPGGAARPGRADGRRRVTRRSHRLRAEPCLAADPQAAHGSGCTVDTSPNAWLNESRRR